LRVCILFSASDVASSVWLYLSTILVLSSSCPTIPLSSDCPVIPRCDLIPVSFCHLISFIPDSTTVSWRCCSDWHLAVTDIIDEAILCQLFGWYCEDRAMRRLRRSVAVISWRLLLCVPCDDSGCDKSTPRGCVQ
jgi:hypothetical protein